MDTSKAASCLGSIRTKKKAMQSRLNGKKHTQGRYYIRTRGTGAHKRVELIDRLENKIEDVFPLDEHYEATLFRDIWNKMEKEKNA